jgi:uncharacterized protein (UPF0335 family)
MTEAAPKKDNGTRQAPEMLKSFVERVERLIEERKTYTDDIRDVFAEAKGNGFDVKALRTVIKLRAQDEKARKAQAAIVDTYSHALGIEW